MTEIQKYFDLSRFLSTNYHTKGNIVHEVYDILKCMILYSIQHFHTPLIEILAGDNLNILRYGISP